MHWECPTSLRAFHSRQSWTTEATAHRWWPDLPLLSPAQCRTSRGSLSQSLPLSLSDRPQAPVQPTIGKYQALPGSKVSQLSGSRGHRIGALPIKTSHMRGGCTYHSLEEEFLVCWLGLGKLYSILSFSGRAEEPCIVRLINVSLCIGKLVLVGIGWGVFTAHRFY